MLASLLAASLPFALAMPAAAVEPATDFDALFQKVYEDPTNPDANFKFATEAAKKGDYEAAIGALERMLFYNPDLPEVKFELGVLYFKIGSYAMAKSYFESAKGTKGEMSNDVRRKIDEFLAEIDHRLSPSQLDFFSFTGARYQTNANSGPDDLLVRAFGVDAILSSKYGRQEDWNWFTYSAGRYTLDFGNQRGDSLEARFAAYYAGQAHLTDLNYGVLDLEVGPRFGIFPGTTMNVYGIAQGEILGDAPFMEGYGAGIAFRSTFGDALTVEPSFEYRKREFHNSDPFPEASGQTGELMTAALSVGGALGPLHWIGRVAYDYNRASDGDYDYNSYDRISYELAIPFDIRFLFGQWRITPMAGGSLTNFAAPNIYVDPDVVRADNEYFYGVTVEKPLNKSLSLRAQVIQSVTESNLPNYTTEDLSAVVGVTYRN
jgi:hypothetical protein